MRSPTPNPNHPGKPKTPTPGPTLTDEELAEMERWSAHHLTPVERRLIAALRASRTHQSECERQLQQWVDRVLQVEAEVERLRAGLDFYADPANWESHRVPNADPPYWESGIAIDGGKRARRALNTPVAPPTLT